MKSFKALEKLRIADPDTYVWVKGRVEMLSPPPSAGALGLLVDETIWGLSQEAGLGAAVAKGLLQLMHADDGEGRDTYVRLVHEAAQTGVTLGRIVATFLAPVLCHGHGLLDRFQGTLEIMMGKGSYTLTTPLEVVAEWLTAGDGASARAYLELLAATFVQPISYNQSLRLVYLLPKAVRGFAPKRRETQIRQLCRLVQVDLQLVEPFLEGMEKELGLLDGSALAQFTASALKFHSRTPEAGMKFLSLKSKVSQDACAALQRAVTLARVQGQLNRYLYARTGRAVAVKPATELPAALETTALVASDGRFIYLPDELDRFEDQAGNLKLYKALVRLEAGCFECRSFDFDLDRAADRYPASAQWNRAASYDQTADPMCDGERFIRSFSIPPLADDLFTLYEQARVDKILNRRYPGMVDRVMPLVQDEAHRMHGEGTTHLLGPVVARLVLGMDMPYAAEASYAEMQKALVALFARQGADDLIVEDSAGLAHLAFERLVRQAGRALNRYRPYPFPFGRRINWGLVSMAAGAQDRMALRIKLRLEGQDLRVYRSDVKQRLAERQGRLSVEDIAELVIRRTGNGAAADESIDISGLDLEDLLQQSGIDSMPPGQNGGEAFYHPEWDHQLQDYLQRHTRVRELTPSREGGDAFYQTTLLQHGGLVARMRRAFELLKPEGLALLRQWPEGDAFDYRALLDFAIDRRAGRIPSDRLFIKRLKQERDVAVLLLVDLSRSTANPVAGGHTTVLDLAKAAAVLFCEALEVVGDNYAIAGFSGSGRHAVDFYGIKLFAEPLGQTVRARLSSLQPQRSTRMGAAIRQAGSWLAKAESRVRLLLVVSDGFPNDLGYKADYAIADTRRAVQEARSRNYHVKAITVNIGSDPRLDDLYGRMHHHVIGDVRELPDKLLRLYGTLTRCY